MTLATSLLDLFSRRGSDFVLPEVDEMTPWMFRSKALVMECPFSHHWRYRLAVIYPEKPSLGTKSVQLPKTANIGHFFLMQPCRGVGNEEG